MVFIWNPSGMFTQHNCSSIYGTYCFVSKKCCKTCFKWQTQTYLKKGQVSGNRMNQTSRSCIQKTVRLQLLMVVTVNVRRSPNIEIVQINFHFSFFCCSLNLWWCFSFIWENSIKCVCCFKNLLDFKFIMSNYLFFSKKKCFYKADSCPSSIL